jgi:sulfur-oxidizing protein SoxY
MIGRKLQAIGAGSAELRATPSRRRSLLQAGLGLTVARAAGLAGSLAGLLGAPLAAFAAWNKEAFRAKSVADALKGIGAAALSPTKDLAIDAPEIAENGAVVPIEITSTIASTRSLSVLAEKNPFPLVAKFDFTDGALPYVKLNLKLSETADVRVIAEADGRNYTAAQNVKVTIGGCGG